jgi:uncharacterized protein with HEPN domain
LKRAVVRSLEIIGEAVKKLPDDFKEVYGGVDWRAIAGIRDHLLHDYLGVDYDKVSDAITAKVPGLSPQVKDARVKYKFAPKQTREALLTTAAGQQFYNPRQRDHHEEPS